MRACARRCSRARTKETPCLRARSPRVGVRPATSNRATARTRRRSTTVTTAHPRVMAPAPSAVHARTTAADGRMPVSAAARPRPADTTVVLAVAAPDTADTARPRPRAAHRSSAGVRRSVPAATRPAASATAQSPVAVRPRTTVTSVRVATTAVLSAPPVLVRTGMIAAVSASAATSAPRAGAISAVASATATTAPATARVVTTGADSASTVMIARVVMTGAQRLRPVAMGTARSAAPSVRIVRSTPTAPAVPSTATARSGRSTADGTSVPAPASGAAPWPAAPTARSACVR